MQKVIFQDLKSISYQKAWDYQQQLLNEAVALKRRNKGLTLQSENYSSPKHHLLFCHHPPVYTLGKSGSLEHLLLNETQLKEQQIEFYKINRGGDITFHGPGQIVGYPIFDLDEFFTDVRKYVQFLEEAVIRTLLEYNLNAFRIKGFTGVWLPATEALPKRKICAIGVHLSRWVTMHGFAFNINTDLQYFKNIIPCGIEDKDKDVTSLAKELGHTVEINEVKAILKKHFADLFGFQYSNESDLLD